MITEKNKTFQPPCCIQVAGTLLRSVYKCTSMFGPLFFLGVNMLMYSYLLSKSKLVPRPLAVLGIAGATPGIWQQNHLHPSRVQ